ncbi:hypothetical protein RHMOL_Rhmol04G0156900 [Rhododendron molle]|uniref:Uncharacterized protein n=1 Tax=Rhododendron molle TaxID=49168 RepID=A0ACC0P1Y3_RHOML|nr:hypothetical protein RHMOL_Rhmol04G0156900 [Rhododendron molle]
MSKLAGGRWCQSHVNFGMSEGIWVGLRVDVKVIVNLSTSALTSPVGDALIHPRLNDPNVPLQCHEVPLVEGFDVEGSAELNVEIIVMLGVETQRNARGGVYCDARGGSLLGEVCVCVATGCERNWSTFEFIHSKRRNRLEHKRLNDLVYVRYNLKLRERIIRQTKDALDPINLENIDVLDDWVSEEPGVLDEEDIAWEIIEPPSLEALTLDDQEPNFDDAAVDFPNENESQYDYWDIGGHNDPYVIC